MVGGGGTRRRQGSHDGLSSSKADRQKSSGIPCQGDSRLQEDQEKELMELGLPPKSVGRGNKSCLRLENKVWLGNSSQRTISKAEAGVGRKPEKLLNNSMCSRKISACSEGESFKSTYTLSPDAAQIFLFKEVCDPGSRLKSDLYDTKEIPESRTPLRLSKACQVSLCRRYLYKIKPYVNGNNKLKLQK